MNYLNRLVKNYKTKQDQKLPIPKNYPFVMHPKEIELFRKYIQSSKNYLEFGLGGSTIYTLIHSECIIYCVDSNQSWLDFMKKYTIIQNHYHKRLNVFLENIGPTKKWGFPVDESHKELFPDFSKNIYSQIPTEDIDLVLIDGRFRVACALMAVIQFYTRREHVHIMIHDYTIRSEYSIIEKYLERIDGSDTLMVFKIKEEVDLDEVWQDYANYQYTPD